MVKLPELVQGVHHVPLVPGQGAAGQPAAAGQHPSFHERVHSRHLDPAEYDFDPGVFEHGAEQGRKPAVTVPDGEPRPAACFLQIRNEVPRGLDTRDALG